jgi:hypothetical protein
MSDLKWRYIGDFPAVINSAIELRDKDGVGDQKARIRNKGGKRPYQVYLSRYVRVRSFKSAISAIEFANKEANK